MHPEQVGRYQIPISEVLVIEQRTGWRGWLRPGFNVYLRSGVKLYLTEAEKAELDESLIKFNQILAVSAMVNNMQKANRPRG